MEQLNTKHLRVLYYQYKDTAAFSVAVSFLIILINFIIFSAVVKPQYATWQDYNTQLEEVNRKIEILESNNRVLQSLDPSSLTSDVQIVLASLPKEGDFIGIMNAIASASTNSGVVLEDYSFKLGELVLTKPDTQAVGVSLSIRADANSLYLFIKEIHQKLPLANVQSFEGANDTTVVKVTFYSKALSAVNLTEEIVTTPLAAPSSKDRELLDKLSSWQATMLPTDDFGLVGSASADISPF